MQYRGLPVCAMLLALSASAGAQATGTSEPRAREEVVRERVEAAQARARAMADRWVNDTVLMNRAVLGVTLSQTGSRRDTLGVFIPAVAANGPAERAGIVEGDRIAMINNVDVRTPASDIGDSYLSGVGQARLRSEMRRLAPGQRVNLRIWSGGRYRDVQVTTSRYSEVYPRRTVINIGDGSMLLPARPARPARPLRPVPPVAPVPPAPPAPPAPLSPSMLRLDDDFEDLGLVLAELGATISASVSAALAALEGDTVDPRGW
jgi:hypothetical protein